MTPYDHIKKLKIDHLKEIDLFFTENNLKEIEFNPIPNDLDIEPYLLNNKGILTLMDEVGNDSEYDIKCMPIEIITHILTLIQTSAYDTTN